MKFRPIIGLEVHAQVKTESKMFCGCPANVFGRKPNSATCPVCLGLPGALPVPNRMAIRKVITLARALNCKITDFSQFERKNYFYPDLPKGFQISQYAEPIGRGGKFEGVAISRVHLEEDTGKLIHERSATLVDFNRSGIPLVEIVTEPEFSDPEGVTKFLKELRTTLVHFEISSADMERGSLRLEGNVSLQKEGTSTLPAYKVELKNINSFAFLEKALRVEIGRQTELLERGEKISQETRGYDQKRKITVPQRKKEESFDYRYFPEPDVPPLTSKTLAVKGTRTRTFTADAILVDSPQKFRERYLSLGLSRPYAEVFLADKKLAAIFDQVRKKIPVVEAAHVIVNKRFGDPKKLGSEGIVAAYQAERKREVVSGGELNSLAEKVVLDNPKAVSDYAGGKEIALQFLLGQLMRETGGRVKPKEGRGVLKETIRRHARAQVTSKN